MKYKVTMPKSCVWDNSSALKTSILIWLNENIGERSVAWDYPVIYILEFLNEEDSIKFALTWT